MIRLIVRLACVVTLAGMAAIGAALPAGADPPLQQAWWTATNPGAVTLPAPPPSDVPADGLLAEGGPNGPVAFGALFYDVGDGAVASRLTLTVAGTSVTTPGAALDLCPIPSGSFITEQGGPMSDAPAYNCTTKATAKPDTSGTHYTFAVSKLVADGTLAVAVIAPDVTSRVVLAQPGARSLVIQRRTSSHPVPAPTPAPAPAGSGGTTSGSGAPPVGGGLADGSPPSIPSAPVPSAAPSPQVAPGQSMSAASVPASPASPDGGKASPAAIAGVLGALLLAATLWALAGNTPRVGVAEGPED